MLVKVPAMAVNVPEVEPPNTYMDDCTARRLRFSLASTIFTPPAGAAVVIVTVQVLISPGPRLAGLQTSEEMAAEDTSATEALCEELPRVAVTVAV